MIISAVVSVLLRMPLAAAALPCRIRTERRGALLLEPEDTPHQIAEKIDVVLGDDALFGVCGSEPLKSKDA